MSINYDYTLDILGLEDGHYRPKYKKQLNNVVQFNGRTGSGKSTLFNMLAIACCGCDDNVTGVKGSLRKDVINLYNDYEREFNFVLEASGFDNTKLKFEVNKTVDKSLSPFKVNHNISIYESVNNLDYIKLSDSKFKTKYHLIYDMPSDPRKRILDIEKDLISVFGEYSKSLPNVLQRLNLIKKEIDDSNDISKVEEYKNKIIRSNEELNDKKSKKEDHNKTIKLINQLNCALRLSKYLEDKKQLKNKKIQKTRKDNFSDREYRVKVTRYLQAQSAIKSEYDCLKSNYEESLKYDDIISKYSNINDYSKWISFEFGDIVLKMRDAFPPQFETYLNIIYANLSEASKKNIDPQEINKQQLLEQLIGILRRYQGDDIHLLDQNISGLLDLLEKESREVNNELSVCNKLKNATSLFKNIIVCYDKILDKIGDFPEKPVEDHIQEDENSIEEEYNTLLNKIKMYKNTAIEYGVSEDNCIDIIEKIRSDSSMKKFFNMDEKGRSGELSLLNKEIGDLDRGISELDNRINFLQGKINMYEGRKPSLFTDYKEKINNIYLKAMSMQRQIESMLAIIKTYTSESTKKYEPKNEFEQIFLEKLWQLLANKFDTIWFDDRFITIKNVNLNDEAFYTDNGEKIKFYYLSTGQNHRAYINSLLNSNIDKKLIIILDEVALMDPSLLEEVREKLKEMYHSNRLLIGFMASPGSTGYEVIE